MKVHSVNVSLPKDVSHEGKTITTSIFKEPVPSRVIVRRLNIDGDDQADRRVHGVGFDMAIYVYPIEHYAFWEKELGREKLPHGQFGENLTVSGLSEDTVQVGDIYRVGETLLQVTQPRIPCYKLAIRMGEGSDFPARFQQSGRMGFYLRVLDEGELGAGDSLELVERDESSVTIAEFIRIYLFESHEPESLRRVLSSRNVSEPWQAYFEKMLKKAEPVLGPDGWEGFRPFMVDRKVPESEGVMSFYLAPEDGEALPDYLPGQFLTFRLVIPGHSKPVMRTYSLSDSPNHPDYYRVTIKRIPVPENRTDLLPGLSSNYFHDQVESGARLCVKSPRGEFHLDPQDDSPVVLLSGGVGLTPMISMLNAIVDAGSQRPVWFVHGARNGREHAMGEHVRRMALDHDNINCHFCYSSPGPEDIEGRHYDSGNRVSVELLKRVLPPAAYDFYLCGPTSFMKSLHAGLLDWGVAESRISYEFFGPAAALNEGAGAASSAVAGSNGEFQVTFADAELTAQWDPLAESILGLAEANGLRPDFSCRTGICHTCASKLIEGEVEYVTEPLDLPDPGTVLICCSRPKTDLVIDV
jgi:ferredoxin-NADP reductase/MOSC domain-containing protein YiiM